MGRVVLMLALLAKPPTPTLDVRPRFGHAPATVHVKLRVFEARDWCLKVSSEDGFERGSCEAATRVTFDVFYQDLPAGHYTVALVVGYEDGSHRLVSQPLCVLGGDITCSEEP